MEHDFNSGAGNRNNGDTFRNGNIRNGLKNDKATSETDQFEVDLRQLGILFRRYRAKIIGIVLLTTLVFGLFAFFTDPIYKSEGSLLISEPRTRGPAGGSGISALIASMYGIGISNTLDNELEILRSRSLSEEIADELKDERYLQSGKQYPLLWRNYPVDSTVVSRDTVAMRIRENMSISQVNDNSNVVEIAFESVSPEESAHIVNLAMSTYSELSTRQNRLTASSAVEFLRDELQRVEENLSDAEQNMRDFMNSTQLLDIERQTGELITRMSSMEADRQANLISLEAVNSAIEQYEQRLAEIGPGLSEQISSAIGPKINRFQYRLAELETEKMLLLSQNPEIKDQPDPPIELKQLNEKITQVQDDIRLLTDDLVTESSERLALLGERDGSGIIRNITEIHQRLIELQADRNQYHAQNELLNQRLAEEQVFFDRLPDNRIEFARLQRNVEINEQLYRNLSEQFAEMQLLEQTRFGHGRVVDRGNIPVEPVEPKPLLFLIGGFFIGSLIAIGYMGLSELLNYKIDRLDKLEKLNIPVLAVITGLNQYIKEKHDGREEVFVANHKVSTRLITFFDNASRESEAFRWLLNNIIYSQPGRTLRSLMITSSRKEEEKAVVTANLGLVMAESGKKVLIIDADWRSPGLHTLFGLKQSPGIADTVHEFSASANIQHTVVPGLDLLASGRIPTGLSMVNHGNRIREQIESLKTDYDIVLIKTAPFGIYADAASLISHTDGVIVTARFGSTSEDELKVTLGNLQRINANLLGIVLADFDSNKRSAPVSNKSNSYSKAVYRSIFTRSKPSMKIN